MQCNMQHAMHPQAMAAIQAKMPIKVGFLEWS
jgi:hypothetical protein